MKTLATLLIFSCSAATLLGQAPEKILLAVPGKAILEDKLAAPMLAPWKLAKGKWEPLGGVTRCTFLPEDHHGAVAAISQKGLKDFTLSYEFKFVDSTNNSIALDGTGGHPLRITISPTSIKFNGEGPEPVGKLEFANIPVKFRPNTWHSVRMEVVGNIVLAKVDEHIAYGENDFFKTLNKSGVRLCVANGTVDFRNFSFREATLNPEWPTVKKALPKPKAK